MASFTSRHNKDLNRLLEKAAKDSKNRLDKHLSGNHIGRIHVCRLEQGMDCLNSVLL